MNNEKLPANARVTNLKRFYEGTLFLDNIALESFCFEAAFAFHGANTLRAVMRYDFDNSFDGYKEAVEGLDQKCWNDFCKRHQQKIKTLIEKIENKQKEGFNVGEFISIARHACGLQQAKTPREPNSYDDIGDFALLHRLKECIIKGGRYEDADFIEFFFLFSAIALNTMRNIVAHGNVHNINMDGMVEVVRSAGQFVYYCIKKT